MNLESLYQDIVSDTPALQRGIVWCHTCGGKKRVDAAKCLQYGWPMCCGETMSLDIPQEEPK